MAPTTEKERNVLQEKANRLVEFQTEILDSLTQGESPKEIAKLSRQFLTRIYGKENDLSPPSGADLGISVNKVCNLRCSHCYYANTHVPDNTEEGAIDAKKWRDVTSQAVDLGMSHISIIGKEPLLSPDKTRAILETIDEKRKKGFGVRQEIITNGTLIDRNIDWLSQHSDFYFFSVSFDGYREDHDKVRGKGAYRSSLEGLKIAKRAGIKNLTAIFTAMPHNISSLERMVEDLAEAGFDYLSIGYCFPTAHNEQELTAGVDLFRRTVDLAPRLPSHLEVSLNILGDEHAPIIAELYKEGFFSFDSPAATEDLAPSLIIPLSQRTSTTPRALVNCTILPTVFYGGFRIDYDGTAMDFCADLRTQEKRGFGNVKDNTIKELYVKSRAIWPEYTERYYDRLSKALKGEKVGAVQNWYDVSGVK